MQVILQFCLIAIFVEEAFSSGVCYPYYACVNLKNWNLRIPHDNSKVRGEKNNAGDSWHTYINWLDKPAGDLKLSYKVQYVYDGWHDVSSGILSVYEKGQTEKHELAKLMREALGLNNPLVKIPGRVQVDRNLFSGDKCIGINLEKRWDLGLRYRIFVDVTDDDGKLFLAGQIVKYES